MGDQDTRTLPAAARSGGKIRPKRKSFARRQEDARKWLERLVPPEKITEERIKELAAYVDRYRPGSRYQQIADAMVRNNEQPSYAKVAARYQARKEAWQRRNTTGKPVELTEDVLVRLTSSIAQSWAAHNRGPSWTEVGEIMGWDRPQTRDALNRLYTEGVVSFSAESGSLALSGRPSRRAYRVST
ncbi:hypothetical protein [Paenarthrobacter aromaticivorans]|uniref:Uncharacterized protein n=1 Tax=Paenarthrobacter aromaticivorans TaxID=2849150 RepID=A0ABS6I7Y0_9MICC|nr:hypothetical protein [Paenarthrobacter sp. MMS21-TAE1-1]MBU8867822.1 hypothetical protein [Paenarthrobacter sp. MMS21-TAE1-1]